MNTYHAWFDLKNTSKDLEFSDHLQRYLDHLKEEGKVHGYVQFALYRDFPDPGRVLGS